MSEPLIWRGLEFKRGKLGSILYYDYSNGGLSITVFKAKRQKAWRGVINMVEPPEPLPSPKEALDAALDAFAKDLEEGLSMVSKWERGEEEPDPTYESAKNLPEAKEYLLRMASLAKQLMEVPHE